ncbi:sugar phosphate isomerase/epimerase family protein [Ruthenibacterium lactatiformans]|uniref:sugar phosphate isomerase/epimerase family protein n=1 Tax=Ruthenibacterium lactatiformans TaxID=1550024 RepID=UPI003AB9B79B
MKLSSLALNATSLCANEGALALPIAQAAGLKAVEITAGKSPRALIKPTITKDELAEWKQKLAAHGLTALALGAHRDLGNPEEFSAFETLLEKGQMLGCRLLTTAVPDTADDERFMEGLARAGRRAEELGLLIALETHGKRHGTGVSLLPFLQASPAVSLCYDTGNVLFYGGVSPLDDLPRCISHVGHMHLKDKAGAIDAWDFPALGKGMVDFAALFSLEGWQETLTASIEVEFTPAGATVEEVQAAVTESAHYLCTFPLG